MTEYLIGGVGGGYNGGETNPYPELLMGMLNPMHQYWDLQHQAEQYIPNFTNTPIDVPDVVVNFPSIDGLSNSFWGGFESQFGKYLSGSNIAAGGVGLAAALLLLYAGGKIINKRL